MMRLVKMGVGGGSIHDIHESNMLCYNSECDTLKSLFLKLILLSLYKFLVQKCYHDQML